MSRALLAVAALALAVPVVRAQPYKAEDEDFSNSAFVRVAADDVADLYAGDRRAADGDSTAAIAAWQRVLDRSSDGVVEIGPRLHASGADAVRMRLLRADAPVRAEYERLFGARAEAAVRGAVRHRDAGALFLAARRFPTTRAAARALQALIAIAAERRDAGALSAALDEAIECSAANATDFARAILAFGSLKDERALRAVERRGGAALDLAVAVAGDESTPRALLAKSLEECVAASASIDAAAAEFAKGGLSMELLGAWDALEGDTAVPEIDPRGQRPLELSSHSACTVPGGLFALGTRVLASVDLTDRRIESSMMLPRELSFDPSRSPPSDRLLEPVAIGDRIWFTFTPTRRFMTADGGEESTSLLVAWDRSRKSLAVKRDVTDASFGEFAGYVLEGPPARFGELVLVSGSRLSQNTECALFAFDVNSGDLAWARFLASAARIPNYDPRNYAAESRRQPPSPVVVADGTAYVVTNLGVIAALDARSGAVRWMFRYKRRGPEDAERFKREAKFDTGGWTRAAPAVMGERLIATPEDSRFLYVLARRPSTEGQLLLDATFKADLDGLLLADPDTDLLFFAARQYESPAQDAQFIRMRDVSGKIGIEKLKFEAEERIVGRPALVGRTLVLPTNKRLCLYDLDRDLLMFDELYAPVDRSRAGRRSVFGNLLWSDGALYSTSSAFIVRVVPRR